MLAAKRLWRIFSNGLFVIRAQREILHRQLRTQKDFSPLARNDN